MPSATSPLLSPLIGTPVIGLPMIHGLSDAGGHADGAEDWERRDRDGSRARVVVAFAPEAGDDGLGPTTMRLVERTMDTMQALRRRADTISAQALDLIELTRRERLEMQAELSRAREEAAAWRHQAMEAELRMRDAQLRVREAEMGCREAQRAASDAHRRAQSAEAEIEGLETYLRKIGGYLQARLGSYAR